MKQMLGRVYSNIAVISIIKNYVIADFFVTENIKFFIKQVYGNRFI